MLLAHQVDEIRGVAGVKHGEPGAESERGGVHPDEAVRDRVKRPAEHAARPARHRHERARAPEHLPRRATREREQQDPLRCHALTDQPGHSGAQRRGLAGARAGEDQQRSTAVCGGGTLLRIQLIEPAICIEVLPGRDGGEHVFRAR